MYGRNGADNPNWKGGVTPERQALYSSQEWASVVQQVWQRDQATCQRCGLKAGTRGGDSFHIHHIISFAVKDLRLDLDNLVLLCRDCHSWVHSKANTGKEFLG